LVICDFEVKEEEEDKLFDPSSFGLEELFLSVTLSKYKSLLFLFDRDRCKCMVAW
jgi:hypothetical protein